MIADAPITLDNVRDILVDDTKVKIAAVDIDGVLRGKVLHKSKFLNVVESGFGFCSVLFGWDIQDTIYKINSEFGSSDCAFPDLIAKVDLSTYRRIPWEDNIPFFLVHIYHPATNEPLYCCPRSLLGRTVDDYQQKLGCTPYCGIEFEFFCFKETSASLEAKGYTNLEPLTRGMCGYSLLRPLENQEFYYRTFDWLREFRVDIESWHTETGPGVFEAAVAYAEAREAGDRAALFKTSIKQLAFKHGFMASFMAKPYQNLPGCSGHMHFSLKDEKGRNLFYPHTEAEKSHIPNMSLTMVRFLAGVLRGLPSILAILAPTVNSYKRLVENYWAPVSVSWGVENRLGAIRAIIPPTASPSAARLEVRVSGADINPHLALAAVLRCGLWGITTEQTLPVKPQNEIQTPDEKGERLARSLQEAIAAMDAKSSVARQVLGDAFVDHFVATRKHEWDLWQNAVTDYERKRYMELV